MKKVILSITLLTMSLLSYANPLVQTDNYRDSIHVTAKAQIPKLCGFAEIDDSKRNHANLYFADTVDITNNDGFSFKVVTNTDLRTNLSTDDVRWIGDSGRLLVGGISNLPEFIIDGRPTNGKEIEVPQNVKLEVYALSERNFTEFYAGHHMVKGTITLTCK